MAHYSAGLVAAGLHTLAVIAKPKPEINSAEAQSKSISNTLLTTLIYKTHHVNFLLRSLVNKIRLQTLGNIFRFTLSALKCMYSLN